MIYCLTGKIIKKTLDSVVISCGGVGYFVQIPATTGEALPPAGQEGTVYTIMNVTENDVSLYGFAAEEQRDCFKMLTGVTGVGPKAALSILSIICLLYTSDAADEEDSVDLGGRRIDKKKKKKHSRQNLDHIFQRMSDRKQSTNLTDSGT